MRITNGDIVSAPCFTTMDRKDVNGGTVPVTDLKFSPTNTDATNSNGILSPPTTPSTATPSENEYNPSSSNSGRFKFYKDGKFILELWHHKNGERMFWIPVTKNSTCWPPIGPCTPRQESSTSLSVSDDNSSIQSSPWQRDHCWKQAVPRKNINRELEFMMHTLRPRKMRFSSAAIRRRRRRPYDAIIKNEFHVSKCPTRNPTFDDVDVKPPLPPKVEAKPVPQTEHLIHSRVRTRRRLSEIVVKLLERRPVECPPPVSLCRTDPGIVSPRKRILKEMEKVSLEELGNANKKHRARTVFSSSTSSVAPCTTVSVVSGAGAAATSFSGLPTAAITTVTSTTLHMTSTTTTTSTKSTNSHSISSILSRDEEQPSFLRNLLKSPTDVPGVAGTTGDSSSAASPSVDARDARSHDLADMCASQSTHSTPIATLASPPPLAASASSVLSYPMATKSLPAQPPPLHPPPPLPMYITPAFLYHSAPQPFMASPPISNHPPYYSAYTAAGFRDATPIWPVPSVSSLSRQSVYPPSSLLSSYPSQNPPSPWAHVVPSSLQSYQIIENGTDVPLNLSKH